MTVVLGRGEVSWDIVDDAGGATVLTGGAPFTGSFCTLLYMDVLIQQHVNMTQQQTLMMGHVLTVTGLQLICMIHSEMVGTETT